MTSFLKTTSYDSLQFPRKQLVNNSTSVYMFATWGVISVGENRKVGFILDEKCIFIVGFVCVYTYKNIKNNLCIGEYWHTS